MSYINNIYVNIFYCLLLVYEYTKYKSIENTKNIIFIPTIGKSIVYTYLYVDKMHYYVILSSSLFSIVIYKIRYQLYKMNYTKYMFLLKLLLHICIMNTLFISSITAI